MFCGGRKWNGHRFGTPVLPCLGLDYPHGVCGRVCIQLGTTQSNVSRPLTTRSKVRRARARGTWRLPLLPLGVSVGRCPWPPQGPQSARLCSSCFRSWTLISVPSLSPPIGLEKQCLPPLFKDLKGRLSWMKRGSCTSSKEARSEGGFPRHLWDHRAAGAEAQTERLLDEAALFSLWLRRLALAFLRGPAQCCIPRASGGFADLHPGHSIPFSGSMGTDRAKVGRARGQRGEGHQLLPGSLPATLLLGKRQGKESPGERQSSSWAQGCRSGLAGALGLRSLWGK